MPFKDKNKAHEYKVEYYKKYYRLHKDKYRLKERNWRRKTRLKILKHYGHICNCCGETTEQFLTVDHINNDGFLNRENLGSHKFYRYIIKNNFPKNLQMLCMNCNFGKRMNKGVCPHEESHNPA